jgi:uncharacterized membrane protein YqjE
MADSAVRQQAGNDREQSLGALVSLAVKDVTQLLRCELDLAKIELKADARRAAIAAVLLVIAAFVACLVLMLACFAFAYGLMAAGIWGWASFLIVAGTCILLAALAVLVGVLRFRGMSGLKKTRGTVRDGISLLRSRGDRAGDQGAVTGPAAGG